MVTPQALKQKFHNLQIFLLLGRPIPLRVHQVGVGEGCVALVGVVETGEEGGGAGHDGFYQWFVGIFCLG